MIKVKGHIQVAAAIETIKKRVIEAAHQSLIEEGNEVMADAKQNYVPMGVGDLASSGQVEKVVVSNVKSSVRLFFDSVYALITHENPRSGKTHGVSPSGKKYYYRWARTGQWKYLEHPIIAESNKFLANIANKIRKNFF